MLLILLVFTSFLYSAGFESIWTTPGSTRTYSAKFADFDNDGKIDIVFAYDLGGPSEVYKGDAISTFTLAWANTISTDAAEVVVGDYDNDTDLDIFICRRLTTSHNVRIYRNDGNFNFVYSTGWNVPTGVRAAALGDYDNDGDLDLVITGAGGDRFIRIYKNEAGLFELIFTSTITCDGRDIHWVDIELDGDLDIVASDWTGRRLLIYKNLDFGTTFQFTTTITGFTPFRFDLIDIDNDKDFDIIVSSYSSATAEPIFIYTNTDGEFTLTLSTHAGSYITGVSCFDYNNDGNMDIMVARRAVTGTYDYLLKNNGNLSFSNVWSTPEIEESQARYDFADIDNDGRLDMLSPNYVTGTVPSRVYRSSDTTILPNTPPTPPNYIGTVFTYTGSTYGLLELKWTDGWDAQTPQDALLYNIRIGTTPSGCKIKSHQWCPELTSTFSMYKSTITNLNRYFIKSPPDMTIYFSVQTIDSGLLTSPWSTEILTGTHIPPAKVTDLSAQQTQPDENEIILTWTSTGDDGTINPIINGQYEIRYTTSPGMNFWDITPIVFSINTEYGKTEQKLLTGLLLETSYFFWIRLSDERFNYSDISNKTTAFILVIPPAKITDLSANITNCTIEGQIRLTWTSTGDDGLTGDIQNGRYWIKYTTNSLKSFDEAEYEIIFSTTTPPLTQQTIYISGLVGSLTYYFFLKLADEKLNYSEVSNTTSYYAYFIPPASITDLKADRTTALTREIRLTWTSPGDDGTIGNIINGKYHIKYTSNPLDNFQTAPFEVIFTSNIIPNQLQIKYITGLERGVTYYFWIRTADEIPTWSDLSNIASTWAETVIPPGPVTDLTVSTLYGEFQLKLSWTAPGNDGYIGNIENGFYDIRYATFPILSEADWQAIPTTQRILLSTSTIQGQTQVTIVTGLTFGVRYYFAIKTNDGDLEKGWSQININSNESFGTPLAVKNILITQFATRGPTGAFDEYVEIYNPTSMSINISGWRLKRSLATTHPHYSIIITTIPPNTTLPPRRYYLIASPATVYSSSVTVPADLYHTTYLGLPDAGHILLVGENDLVNDLVGYGNALFAESNSPASTGTATECIERLPPSPRTSPIINTNNNNNDFYVRLERNPHNLSFPSEPDYIPPAAITNLTVETPKDKSYTLLLSWISPGDDEYHANLSTGTFIIKYSSFSEINDTNFDIIPNIIEISTITRPYTKQTIVLTSLTPHLTYYFAIKTKDEAGNISTIDITSPRPKNSPISLPPSNFNLVYPTNISTTSLTITFQWEESQDPDTPIYGETVKYELIYSTVATFTPKKSIITQNTFYTLMLEDNKKYFWKVRAFDTYNTSTFSSTSYFVINQENEPPTQASLVSPVNEIVYKTIMPTFLWSASTDPDPDDQITYKLYISSQINFEVYISTTISTTYYQFIEQLNDLTSYYWKVEAIDLFGSSTASQTSIFYTYYYPPPQPARNIQIFDYPNDYGDKLIISWDKNTEINLKGYRIYIANTKFTDTTQATLVESLEKNISSTTIYNLSSNIPYYIAVIPINYANISSIFTPVGPVYTISNIIQTTVIDGSTKTISDISIICSDDVNTKIFIPKGTIISSPTFIAFLHRISPSEQKISRANYNAKIDPDIDPQSIELLNEKIFKFETNQTLLSEAILNISIPENLSQDMKNSIRVYMLNEEKNKWEQVISDHKLQNNTISITIKKQGIYRLLATTLSSDLSNVEVYPNPFISNKHNKIVFRNLTRKAEIKIFNLSGNIVKTLSYDESIDGPTKKWHPITTDAGESVSSGLYFFSVESPDGKKFIGKFSIIK